ncbi:MAG: hypothetical protein ACI32N_06705 [Bulleidia sp.]
MKKSFRSSAKNTLLTGRNMYRDNHGNLIYHNPKTNIVYRIPSTKESTFATYQSRYALAVVCFVFLYLLFNLNLFLSLGISIAAAVFLEWKYRKFLGAQAQSAGFLKKDKIRSMDDTIDLSTGALVLRVVLYMALAVLLVVNTFVSKNVIGNKPVIVISWMVAVLAAFMGIRYIAIAIRKSK